MNSRPKKGPLKKGISTSTPAIRPIAQMDGKKNGSKAMVPASLFPSFEDSVERNMEKHENSGSRILWICEAIKAVGLPRKGASFIAIKKWILGNKDYGTSTKQANFLKKTVVKGLVEGVLKRPKGSIIKPSASGSYLIAKVHEMPKKEKVASKQTAKVASKQTAKVASKQTAKVASKKIAKVASKPSKFQSDSVSPKLNHLEQLDDSNSVEIGRKKKHKVLYNSLADGKNGISKKVLKVPKFLKGASKSKEAAPTSKDPGKSKEASKDPGKSKEASKDPGKSKESAPASSKSPANSKKASKAPAKSKEAAPVLLKAPTDSKISASTSKAPAKSKQKLVSKTFTTLDDESKVKNKPPRTMKLPKKEEGRSMRKDLSDTELDVKRIPRKSLKSYSSDTELDFMNKNIDSTIMEEQSKMNLNKTRKIKKT